MAIKKVIQVDVETGDANAELQKLEGSFKDVDKAAEKTNRSVDDVAGNGGAIAILDQLTGGLATRFKDAFEASSLFNKSLFAQRKALIATGIGALVVALGLIVAYWDDIVDFITQANEKLENQNKLLEASEGFQNSALALNKKKQELNKLEGKSNEELQKQQLAILKRLQEINAEQTLKLEAQLLNLKATATEAGFWETIKANVAFTLFGTKALASESSNLAAQRLKEIEDIKAAIAAAKGEEIDLAIQLFNAENGVGVGGDGKKRGAVSSVGGLTPEGISKIEQNKALNDRLKEQNEKAADDFLILQSDTLQKDFRLSQANAQAKEQLAGATLNILGGLAEEGSALSKGVAISQAVISTYAGINKALAETTDFTPTQSLRFANAAAVGIAGLLNVKKILSTDTVGASANVSAGRGGTPAPSFNVVEGSEGSQITNAINNQDKVSRAFVVSSDVSTSQELDRNIVSNSRL